MEIMKSSTKIENGRYTTSLLWSHDDVHLPESYNMAVRRLICFENKLRKDPAEMASVNDKIEEYLTKGYARKLSKSELIQKKNTWYLPIFSVRNPNKLGKLRIVWDAAATSHGVSLNDVLLKGPDLTVPLINVLLRFREKKVAITGDLREMFHQVMVTETDIEAQRFLWRNCDQNTSPNEYVLSVMTFGAKCSPSLAQYVKNFHASNYKDEFPQAVKAIQNDHYVDDWLGCYDTTEDTIRVALEVKRIHHEGGFEMRNWLSNDRQVLIALNGDVKGTDVKSIGYVVGN